MSPSEVVVVPGGEELLELTVRNLGGEPESFGLVANGFLQGWTVIDPSTVSLPPGGESVVRVAVRPPRRWAVPAGSSLLTIRIVSHRVDEDVAIAESTLSVLSFDDRQLALAQPVQRSRRKAEYDLVLENLGNSRASCRLRLVSSDRRLVARFDPPSIGVDPGDSTVARVMVKSKRRLWRGQERTLPFELQAVQDGHTTAATTGSLLQAPVFTGRISRAVLAVAAVAGVVAGAWFGVVRPEIDAAAERAVAEAAEAATTPAAAQTSAVNSGPDEGGTDEGGTDPASAGNGANGTTSAPATPLGPAFDVRLAVQAAAAEQQVASYTVPEGTRVEVTDVLMQNPNGDTGRLALLRNSTVLYEAALENFLDFPTALRSPFVFGPGDSITVQLTCRAAGSATSGQCSAAITLTGTTAPA